MENNNPGTIEKNILLLAVNYYSDALVELATTREAEYTATDSSRSHYRELYKLVQSNVATMIAKDFFCGELTNEQAIAIMHTITQRLDNNMVPFRDADEKLGKKNSPKHGNTRIVDDRVKVIIDTRKLDSCDNPNPGDH